MKNCFRAIVCLIALAAALAQNALALPLVKDGYFNSITYSGTKTLSTYYGQFGTGTGSTLTLANWSTTGFNFVYAPNTADVGTKTSLNAGAPAEAPGEYNASSGYGNTYLWGTNNGGTVALPATDPAGGDFIAADGAFQTGPITQAITGLTVGKVYALSFYWAAAQQQGYTTATTDKWQVTLGSQTQSTAVYSLPAESFSGWMKQTFDYTATSAMETLSFLAVGTPSGQPPFALLGGVSLDPVPEPSTWMIIAAFSVALTVFGLIRRRRRSRASEPLG